MMSYWERLLSAEPTTTSWPPGFAAATVPPVSPGRVFKKSRVIATSSSAGSLQTVPKKRRPSVLGGGFSTAAGLSSPASSGCPWSESTSGPTASSGCWQELDGDLKQPGRRGSCSESLRDDNDDKNEHADAKATSEISMVGWGDSRRRRSLQRSSRGGTAEWQDGRPRRLSSQGVVLAAATTSVHDSRQETQDEADGGMSSEGPGNPRAARAIPAACVDIEATTSEAGSTSIGVGHESGIFAACPIVVPPAFRESKQVDPTTPDMASTIAAPATTGRLDEATSAPSLSSLNTFDQHKSETYSRFPEARPQQEQRCRRERRADAAFLSQPWFAAAATTESPKVFHNFVFRRNRRRDKGANGAVVSSSSCSSLEELSSVIDESCALTSRDDNATDRSRSAAGNHERIRRTGRSGGSVGNSGGVSALSSSSSRRKWSWEASPSMEWERPTRPGQTKRSCSPPRAANDAFSVVSLGPGKHGEPNGGDGDVGGGGGGGRGGCCMGGPGKRPIKCQRCGSGRVRLFATAASTRLSPGYLHPLLPVPGQGRAEVSRAPTTVASGGRGGGYRRVDATGSGSAAGRLSSPPIGRGGQTSARNGAALTPTMSYSSSSSADQNNISGWSDNGRPGTKSQPSLDGRSGNCSGTAGGREGRIVVDLRGRTESLRPPLRR